MATLPTPGGDEGTWGDELNEFLRVAHEEDGTINAENISIVDTNDNFTATHVEGVLAEIAPQLGGGSVDPSDMNLIIHMEVFA